MTDKEEGAAEEDNTIDDVPLAPTAVAEELVEVVAPADLPADYELTVQHGKDTSVVLIVSKISK